MRDAIIGSNPTHPARLPPAERLDEIAAILAAGLMRMWAHQSSALSADRGDSCLDFSPNRRRHADPKNGKV